ncbi:Hypothetical_protein [Hexamita inflata]|uniref:Hypothetical_protein n=1 Tax=Hexamita inflata TaxID=28002 RepID=A0AA86NX79_9EUKA|nr:Hypothetical protein HINF_LOCUS14633 [Hexamita inflata]
MTYDSACEELVENWTTLSIQVQIERSDLQINCQYSDQIFTDLIQISCDCDESDEICLEYKAGLLEELADGNVEELITEQIHSFNYIIGLQVYNDADRQIYNQVLSIDFTMSQEFNYNYLFLIVLVFFFPLSVYLIFKYTKNIINKCQQLKQKITDQVVICTPENSSCSRTFIVTADEKPIFELIL